ncbi:10812_t:CDS:2, partial [Cetraspora pellucida]
QRLGRDPMREFDACFLYLQRTRKEPKDEIEESKRKEQLAKEMVIHDFERKQVRIAPLGANMEESTEASNNSTKTTAKQ